MTRPFCDTIEQFATKEEIVSILARFAAKHDDKVRQALDGERRSPQIDPELEGLIDPDFRFPKRGHNANRIAFGKYHLHRMERSPDAEHCRRLSAFIIRIQNIARMGEFSFAKPRLIPKYKSGRPDENSYVYRPVSAYGDLTTKTIITLVSDYLSLCFDPYFHDEMLAYRRPRTYHGKTGVTTSNKDAVSTILEFLGSHKSDEIWVTECDIQKFFDILNHNVVLKCFDKMAAMVQVEHPGFNPATVRKLLTNFLESYSFHTDVCMYNKEKGEDSDFWRESLGKNYRNPARYEFEWIDEDIARTNSEREDLTDLGIPQGAALSTILTNIVLQSVDEPLIRIPDPDRLFVRYCDDIVLMHTKKDECIRLQKAYSESLTAHRLVYHEFKPVADKPKKHLKNGYWKAKSKKPFLWAMRNHDRNSAEWIGFLGFEISRDGDVRIRQSSVGKKVDKMFRDMIQIRNGTDEQLRQRHLRKFNGIRIEIPEGGRNGHNLLDSFAGITDNRWTKRQIDGLKKYKDKYSVRLLGGIMKGE